MSFSVDPLKNQCSVLQSSLEKWNPAKDDIENSQKIYSDLITLKININKALESATNEKRGDAILSLAQLECESFRDLQNYCIKILHSSQNLAQLGDSKIKKAKKVATLVNGLLAEMKDEEKSLKMPLLEASNLLKFANKDLTLDLCDAASRGDLQKVKTFVAEEIDLRPRTVRSGWFSPLLRAYLGATVIDCRPKTGRGVQMEVFHYLLSQGANIQCTWECRKSLPWTSLADLAIKEDDEKLFKLLIQYEAYKGFVDNHGNSYLHAAAKYGKHKMIQTLIHLGLNVNARNEREETPLHLAAGNDDDTTVQLLLKYGSNINACNKANKAALDIAIEKKYPWAICLLIERGAIFSNNKYREPLLNIVLDSVNPKERAIPFLKRLIIQGYRDIAIEEWVEEFERKKANTGNLCRAIELGDESQVKLCLKEEVFLNGWDDGSISLFPLFEAVREGKNNVIRLLVEAGANINLTHPYTGLTPLMLAYEKKYRTIFSNLYSLGADPTIKNGFYSLLPSLYEEALKGTLEPGWSALIGFTNNI